ncbi:hypothetical protein L6164_005474 [Bauhinia variegata]|uniref:Uncharacterized protein n=1 Tax=Bauhinia variegata TaxID=167791 RepID=A0ACB9PQZ4_BAUVA|nr:hypothetical protein L6164_005474 [Bauhinia variegata]
MHLQSIRHNNDDADDKIGVQSTTKEESLWNDKGRRGVSFVNLKALFVYSSLSELENQCAYRILCRVLESVNFE